MLSYTYHFYNQTEILRSSEGLQFMGSYGYSFCGYRRSFESIHKWSLAAKLNLAEAIK